jgi:hypothetical protein
MEFVVLIGGPRQDKQGAMWGRQLPSAALFKPITPVTSSTQQAHHQHPSQARRCGQIVINLSGMPKTIEGQSSQLLLPMLQLWLPKAG